MKPLFSIITVTYNAAATVGATVSSVKEQQNVNPALIEHLLIDGASSDDTVAIARREGISTLKVFSEIDNGIYDAMNRGLGYATGEYVIFLNAGDTFHTSKTLSNLVEAVMANDFPGVVYGQTLIVDADRRPLGERHLRAPEKLSLESFRNGMVVCHQAFVALRKIVEPFDLRYRFSADYDWCIRCLQHSRRNLYMGPEYLIDYLHGGLTTKNQGKSLRERFRIMAYYYGWLPTVARHIKFIPRFLKRRKEENRF